jgi:hypothetical protein
MFERNSDIMLPQKKNINKINPTISGKYQIIMTPLSLKKR